MKTLKDKNPDVKIDEQLAEEDNQLHNINKGEILCYKVTCNKCEKFFLCNLLFLEDAFENSTLLHICSN